MNKYINPGRLTDETSPFLEAIKNCLKTKDKYVFSSQLSKKDVESIISFYHSYDVIHIDMEEVDDVMRLQEVCIEEIQKAYPFKRMDKYFYLDETLEQLDHYYNMNWILVIENWDFRQGSAYTRFLNGLLKNGILDFGYKLVLVTGKENIKSFGFTKFKKLEKAIEG
ncbi:MAG: hypothetical protein Q4C49_09185 [Bacillota bacterium]|nr:hypothetical protein [Bacillota bacterium]